MLKWILGLFCFLILAFVLNDTPEAKAGFHGRSAGCHGLFRGRLLGEIADFRARNVDRRRGRWENFRSRSRRSCSHGYSRSHYSSGCAGVAVHPPESSGVTCDPATGTCPAPQ